MKWILLVIAIFVGTFLEVTLIQIPFVLIFLLLALIFIQKPWIILLGIPSGLLLDSLSFRLLGESSLFFIVVMALSFAYGRKFEIQSVGFVIFATLLSSFFYCLIFSATSVFIQVLSATLGAVGIFFCISLYQNHFSSQSHSLGR